MIEKKENKKSIISIIKQGKEVYKVVLNFDLSITTNNSLMKTLKITSSLDFELFNKYSNKINKDLDENTDMNDNRENKENSMSNEKDGAEDKHSEIN